MAGQDGSLVAESPGRTTRESLVVGSRWFEGGDLPRAEFIFRQVLGREPWCAEAWFFLGLIEQTREDPGAAIAHYEEAIRLAPDLAEAHNNLGVILQKLGQVGRAEACYRAALEQMPDYAEAHSNLGNALQDRGRFEEALDAYRRALQHRPGDVEAIQYMGNALRALGRLDEAMSCYEAGLALAPGHVLLHTSRGMLKIQRGDLEGGWPELAWRLCGHGNPLPRHAQPAWDGAPLDGRTLRIDCEQGLGDTMHFIRYATVAARRGGRVIVACNPPLRRILATCPGVDRTIGLDDDGPEDRFDVHAPLISLPRIAGTTLATIPAEVPYLFPDPDSVEAWRDELRGFDGLKVGVVWQGNLYHSRDRERSFRLAQLEPIARVPGVRLFSLQKNYGLDQLGQVAGRFEVIDLGRRLHDLMDTAAAMKNLDLVVTPDSSPAHLAGALGVPAWVALPFVADWRWMDGRDDSPWYPSLRLFRQGRFGDWEGVFARMASALAAGENEPQMHTDEHG